MSATVARPVQAGQEPPTVYLVPWMVAGVAAQLEYMRPHLATYSGLTLRTLDIRPYREGGIIERLPLLGTRTKGSLRSMLCTADLFRARGVRGLWVQNERALFPYLALQAVPRGIPYVIVIDATQRQIASFPEYGGPQVGTATRLKHGVRERLSGYAYRHAAYAFPWSQWAADAMMREYGLPPSRIRVIPPGIDTQRWRIPTRPTSDGAGRRTRLLFVGGDFARKGGPLLLDVFRRHFAETCELHLVTREPVEPTPNVHVYADLMPDDPRLRRLYEEADALVLPTRADCYSLAAIEAMATGLPVILCPVGGIPEIVRPGETGWLIPVGDGTALREAIAALLADPARARTMGRHGRAVVEERYDAAKNTRLTLDLLAAAIASGRAGTGATSSPARADGNGIG